MVHCSLSQVTAWLATLLSLPCLTVPSLAQSGSVGSQAPKTTGPVSRLTRKLNDWPQFRGPNGMGKSDADNPPLQWGPQLNVAWQTELPGAGASSPILFGERIYVTCYSGYGVPGGADGMLEDLERHLIAYDRVSGEKLWQQTVPAKLPEEERVRDHGYAANTPVADDQGVYAFFGKSGVYAYDHQGQLRWSSDVGDGTHGWGTAASPVLYKDLIIVNASVESGALVALERTTGRQRWRAEGIRESWNTPILISTESGRDELIVSRHGDVLAFAPQTGAPLWSCKTDITWYMVPSAVSSGDVVYVLGGRSGTASLAVRTGGSGDVTETHRLWTSQAGSNVPSPILHNGHLYWIEQNGSIAYCAEPKTGDLVYEERLPRFGQVYGSPVLAGNRLYYFARNGRCVVLAAEPEFKVLAENRLEDGSRFDASPAVDGNRLFVRSNRYLYCLQESAPPKRGQDSF